MSGESRQQARARATKGWKEAYLEAREHLILRFGPRSTLEVDVIGHERWVWGRERGEGRAMRCVFCGVARGEASVMTFFARSAWGTSLEIFFSPNRNLPGVRFSQIAHHQPAAAREICCSAEGERRVVCCVADERPREGCHDDGCARPPCSLGPDENMTSVAESPRHEWAHTLPSQWAHSPAPVVVRLPRARSATALSSAPSAPSTAADGTADIPEQQDSISVDGVSVGSLTKAILAMEDDTAEAMYECVMEWAMDVKGMELYEAQEEAIMELADGNSVLLTTPTGSGKTLVATAAIAAATARGDVRARSPHPPSFPSSERPTADRPLDAIDDRNLSARCSLFLPSKVFFAPEPESSTADSRPPLSPAGCVVHRPPQSPRHGKVFPARQGVRREERGPPHGRRVGEPHGANHLLHGGGSRQCVASTRPRARLRAGGGGRISLLYRARSRLGVAGAARGAPRRAFLLMSATFGDTANSTNLGERAGASRRRRGRHRPVPLSSVRTRFSSR